MLSEKLLIPIRILTIVLLCVFIYTAYQGALVAKELRETVHTRLANEQFPLPLGDLPLPGMESQSSGIDVSQIKDADVARQAQRVNDACAKPSAECEKQVGLFCNVLKQKGFTSDGATCDKLLVALQAGDENKVSQYAQQLQSALTK